MKAKKTTSISVKTLLYLIGFSVTILLVLMLMQNIFLRVSYESYQTKKIKTIARAIKKEDINSLYYDLEGLAYDNSICIEYVTSTNTISYNTLMVGCGLNKNNSQINSVMEKIINNNDTVRFVKLVNSSSDTKAILAGIQVENGYVFVYSPLEEVNSTNLVLRGQLIYLTIIMIALASLVAYYLSLKITKPILKITKQAKNLGEGIYNVNFERSDIKEIDELSQTLNHVSEDLSKIDELRRDLMANVSHDLKTPLTMIRAYAEMVRDISYKDKEKRERDLNVIIEETERLNVLVNDILDLSKMQAKADTFKLEKIDLVAIVLEIMNRYEILKVTENYKFILDMPEKATIWADKSKISQVIYNLINNAINYTGEDKTVYVTIKDAKKEFIVEIKDTGKGIKEEELPYIWDKYYKSDKKHQRNVVSTGIGLSIVKEILSQHKFDYGVESVLHEGTTFYFKIRKKKENK